MHEPLTPDLSHRASISSLPHPLCSPLSSQSSVVSSTLNHASRNRSAQVESSCVVVVPASCRVEISRGGIKEF